MKPTDDSAAIKPATEKNTEIDPLFAMSPDDARDNVVKDTFEWAASNTIAGHHIWNRATAYANTRQQPNAELVEALEYIVRATGTIEMTGYDQMKAIARQALERSQSSPSNERPPFGTLGHEYDETEGNYSCCVGPWGHSTSCPYYREETKEK